jgi:hypothetical protein
MRSRKAQLNVWMTAAVFLVVGLLILFIGFKLVKSSKSISNDEKCRLSLVANDVARVVAKRIFPIECPRGYREITLSDVESYGRIDDDRVKSIIAEEMQSCWSKTGGGSLQPFNENWLERFAGDNPVVEVFCIVCSEIDFDDAFKEQAKKQDYKLEGLPHWLVTRKPFGMQNTLYEQITGKSPSPELIKSLMGAEYMTDSSFNFDETHVITWQVEIPVLDVINDEVKYFGKDALNTFSEGIFAIPKSQSYGPGAGLGTPFNLEEYISDIAKGPDSIKKRFEEKPLERVMFTPEDTLSAFTTEKFDYGIVGIVAKRRQFCSIMAN